jgi:hypothetical protein
MIAKTEVVASEGTTVRIPVPETGPADTVIFQLPGWVAKYTPVELTDPFSTSQVLAPARLISIVKPLASTKVGSSCIAELLWITIF